MFLTNLSLQNFRNYTKSIFTFNKGTTVIVGPNTSGKSNLMEALFLLSSGKSLRAENDLQMIRFGEQVARVTGTVKNEDETVLEVVIATSDASSKNTFHKRFLVNNVPKRRVNFMEHFHALLFIPSHLDIIVGSPSLRRNFLDEVLESVDREYRLAAIAYEKALRQRNALLHLVKETGRRDPKRFEYWDDLLIRNGQIMTTKREAYLSFINNQKKELIEFSITYDPSTISEARLEQYRSAEEASGVTLVGPHRDDFIVLMDNNLYSSSEGAKRLSREVLDSLKLARTIKDFRSFGSRGQQRLVVLQLKLLQLQFMEEKLGIRPVLLLDDIFSELDDSHIRHIMDIIGRQQTIITTTHREFVNNVGMGAAIIELGK